MAPTRLAATTAGLAAAGLAAVEARYRRQPGNAISFHDERWTSERKAADHLRLDGRIRVHNLLPSREVMLCDVRPVMRLLSDAAVDDLDVDVRVMSRDPEYPSRPDGYWTAFVVKPGRKGKDTWMELSVDVRGPELALDALYAAWLAVVVDTYGFEGPRPRTHHVVVALRHPDPASTADDAAWRETAAGGALVRPIRTHLLGPLDDIVDVVRRYAGPHARPGDIVTIGESPLAVIQRRFLDPAELRAGWFATRAAQFMSGVGSLGTAGGMEALVEEVGAGRVLAAMAGGALGKLAGRDGWFYRLAGSDARLIDDVTGTLPPYDRFIVLGPEHADEVCRSVRDATGLEMAVVDANDLGAVDVVGRTAGVPIDLVREALTSNPAGNADETTPIVLIRPR